MSLILQLMARKNNWMIKNKWESQSWPIWKTDSTEDSKCHQEEHVGESCSVLGSWIVHKVFNFLSNMVQPVTSKLKEHMKMFRSIWRVSFIYCANAYLWNKGVYSDSHRWKGCGRWEKLAPPSENTQGQSCHHDQPFKFSLVPLIKTLKLKPWSKPTQRAHLLSFKTNSSSSSGSIPGGLCKARPCLKSAGYSGYTSNPLQSRFLPSSFRLDSPFNERFRAWSFRVCVKSNPLWS